MSYLHLRLNLSTATSIMDVSTRHYEDNDPNPVLLQLAREPAHPVLPRQVQQRKAAHTRRERIPLLSSLTGKGRAGTVTTLHGSQGSRYEGQVLAGRPHGFGRYWAQEGTPGQPPQLLYEGGFVRGVRHGHGTAYFPLRREVYSGQWVQGRQTGPGKLTYADGSVYDGMWHKGVRQGVGSLHKPNGSIFVGTYVQDKRQGLGVTYWGDRCRKYVAEYEDDTPTCGAMLHLDDDVVEVPASPELKAAIAAARVQAAAAVPAWLSASSEMPELKVVQPSKVLCREFVAVRQWRETLQQQQSQHQHKSAKRVQAAAAVDADTGTLTATTLNLLRHAFILIAGGDDLAARVLPHQLQELVVLAGLDPAAPAIVKLLQLLQQHMQGNGQCKLSLDDLLHVAAFYREIPLPVLLQQQQQQHVATEAQVEDTATENQQQADTMAEVWRADSECAEAEVADSSEIPPRDGADWGGSNEIDMLAQHIAMHRPQPEVVGAVGCAGL